MAVKNNNDFINQLQKQSGTPYAPGKKFQSDMANLRSREYDKDREAAEYRQDVSKYQSDLDKTGVEEGQRRNTETYTGLANERQRLLNQKAPQMRASTAGTAQTMQAANANAAQLGNAAQAQAAQAGMVNRTDQNLAAGQNSLAGMLMQTASGQGGPSSMAQMMNREATDRGIAQQMAMAASLQGRGNPALAARNAMQNQATLNQDSARQAAQIAAQEQLQARAQLGDVLAQARGQEQNVMGMNQNVNLQNAQLAQQTALANMGAQNQFALSQAEMQQQANLLNAQQQTAANQFNAGAMNNMAQFNANLANQAGMANLDAASKNQLVNNQLVGQTLANQGNLAQNYTANESGWQGMLATDYRNAVQAKEGKDAQTNQQIGSAIGAGIALLSMSDEKNKKDIKEIDNPSLGDRASNLLNKFSFGTLGESLEDEPSFSDRMGGMANAFTMGLMGQPLKKSGNPNLDNTMKGRRDAVETLGSLGSTLGTALAMSDEQHKTAFKKLATGEIYSDKSMKKNVNKVDDFMDKLTPYEYEYKDPKYGTGKQVGVMAQDLEKSEAGSKLVLDTPEGKVVDYGKSLPLLLASQVYNHKRIDELEQGLKMALSRGKGK